MGLKDHRDDRRPRKNTYLCGMIVLVLCFVATCFGVSAIVLGAQANVCITPYSYSKWRTNDVLLKERMKYTETPRDESNLQKKSMGWYSAPTSVEGNKVTWIYEDPVNCITECQMNCTAAFTEQTLLLDSETKGGCTECLRFCTHPWGKNIETCHTSDACTKSHPKHKNIVNFCQPVAMCYQMCAGRGYAEIDKRAGQAMIKTGPVAWNKDEIESGKTPDPKPLWTTAGYENNDVAWYGPTSKNKNLRCIRECEYDGKLTIYFGLAAMCLVWLAPLCILIGSAGELRSIIALIFGALFWTASLILGVDAFLLNMERDKGRGWDMLYYENVPQTLELIGGATSAGHLKVTFNWMMHVIFGFGLMSNMFTLLAFYDREEIWNRRKPEPQLPPVQPRAEPQIEAKAKPQAMSYYGEERARQDEIMSGGDDLHTGANTSSTDPQFDVDIGIKWERHQMNNVTEIMIKEIVPGGPADQACNSGMNGKNVLQPGDVVLLVGNVPNGGVDDVEMHNVYAEPYTNWVHIVRGQPAGTKIRFMFARHSEFMKYQFDIVRETPSEQVRGRDFGWSHPADLTSSFEIEEAEAGVSMRQMDTHTR